MSNTFLFLIANGRISPSVVFLILLLPIIVTIIAFARQVVGVKMFGAYAPIIATYAFLGSGGIIPGILISIIIFLASMILRILTRKLKLGIHYMPRIAILITLVSIIALLLLPFSIYLPSYLSITNVSSTSFILFISLSDIYLTSEIQKGYRDATKLYIETIVVSCLIYLLASNLTFQRILITYPEIIILALVIDLAIGRWKGLRLSELYRFRSVIKEKSKDYA